MVDFFVPDGNEDELANTAINLGIKDFVMLYSIKDFNKVKFAYKKGILIEKKDLKMINKAKRMSDTVVVMPQEKLRQVMEQNKSLYFYGMEFDARMDFMHHRNSGLNHILVRIAKQKKHKFIFSFADFISLHKSKKAIILGRLKQNIMLCRKQMVNITLANFSRDSFQIRNCFESLVSVLESNKLPGAEKE
jgi:hypothetical protein